MDANSDESIIRNKLAGLEAGQQNDLDSNENLWARLSERLEDKPKKRMRLIPLLAAASIVTIIFFVSGIYIKTGEQKFVMHTKQIQKTKSKNIGIHQAKIASEQIDSLKKNIERKSKSEEQVFVKKMPQTIQKERVMSAVKMEIPNLPKEENISFKHKQTNGAEANQTILKRQLPVTSFDEIMISKPETIATNPPKTKFRIGSGTETKNEELGKVLAVTNKNVQNFSIKIKL